MSIKTAKTAVVFAGTNEGRRITEYLTDAGISVHACVTTAYGESLLKKHGNLSVSQEIMDEERMKSFLSSIQPEIVIDATHPYACEATRNIRAACESLRLPYMRLLRAMAPADGAASPPDDSMIFVSSPAQAAGYLKNTSGNILLTTGSKELPFFTALPDYEERVYARVLSLPEIAAECSRLNIRGSHLICMQGPFSEEMNIALIHQTKAAYLVTKNTGEAGGFPEKESAAARCGVKLVVIGNPVTEEGLSYDECRRALAERFEIPESTRSITLVGIGIGRIENMTQEAAACCRNADLIIGAKRIVETAAKAGGNAKLHCEWKSESILTYVKVHPEYVRTAIVLSGDTGFYSGARKLFDGIEKTFGFRPEVLCGISSLVYFCGKLRTSWDDVHVLSLHGAEGSLVNNTARYGRVFALLGTEDEAAGQCRSLTECGMGDTDVMIGEQLGYEEERIIRGKAKELTALRTGKLSVMMTEWNPPAGSPGQYLLRGSSFGYPDELFIRGSVPMTKEEVRTVSLSKLRLHTDSVVFDIGAGTGSVSVEIAAVVPDGKVFAIERNEEGLALIDQNRRLFAADNLTAVSGEAPEALAGLPSPSHAFIGGSGGHMKEILDTLLHMNPRVRITINVIALESMQETLDAVRSLPFTEPDIVQISVSRAKKAGRYHMMTGQNPIWILSFEGSGL